MAEIDVETLARVARWCAEAGRQAGNARIRAALEPLGWDELLHVRALVADPPPARPLGPFALADLARGTSPEVAAEREREGRYAEAEARADAAAGPEAAAEPAAEVAPRPAAAAEPAPPKGRNRRRPAQIVVHRARDRAAEVPPAAPALPLLEALQLPEGRAVLERLIRRHGGRRGALLAELASGYRKPDGQPPGSADLEALLDAHGLARAYARREHDEILHALRAVGGVRARAAARLGLDTAALDEALARVGAAAEAERIRDERRAEVRARATLSERVQLLLQDEERLADLGLLDEIEADLRARLPEHLRALRAAAGEPLPDALGRTLSLPRPAVDALAARLGLALGDSRPTPAPSRDRAAGSRGRAGGGGNAPPRRRGGPGPRRASGTGAPGPRRPSGSFRTSGAPGPRRPSGGFGASGASGARRPSGGFRTSGAPGPRRPSGGFGASGASGARRPSGSFGTSGAPGPRRPSGGSGTSGAPGPRRPSGAPPRRPGPRGAFDRRGEGRAGAGGIRPGPRSGTGPRGRPGASGGRPGASGPAHPGRRPRPGAGRPGPGGPRTPRGGGRGNR